MAPGHFGQRYCERGLLCRLQPVKRFKISTKADSLEVCPDDLLNVSTQANSESEKLILFPSIRSGPRIWVYGGSLAVTGAGGER